MVGKDVLGHHLSGVNFIKLLQVQVTSVAIVLGSENNSYTCKYTCKSFIRYGYDTHTLAKGFSYSKFAAVNFYSGKLYQGDWWLHVNLFTTVDFRFHAIIFPGNT